MTIGRYTLIKYRRIKNSKIDIQRRYKHDVVGTYHIIFHMICSLN